MPKVAVVETRSSERSGRRADARARGTATSRARTWEMMISSRSMGKPVAMI